MGFEYWWNAGLSPVSICRRCLNAKTSNKRTHIKTIYWQNQERWFKVTKDFYSLSYERIGSHCNRIQWRMGRFLRGQVVYQESKSDIGHFAAISNGTLTKRLVKIDNRSSTRHHVIRGGILEAIRERKRWCMGMEKPTLFYCFMQERLWKENELVD